MLSETALADYRRDGFVVLPDILTMAEVEALRRVTEQLVEGSRAVAANDEIYDLEDTHTSAEPRVRRIKTPHLHHAEYARAARNPKIVERIKRFVGHGAVRHRQAQHEIGRLWRAGRMAPGLGVLSAHQ